MRVIHFSSNAELPEAVRAKIPDDVMQSVFRVTLNSHLSEGRTEMHAYVRAYRALEEMGWARDDGGTWVVRKDCPCVGDVHVPRPLGSDEKKPKRKDDPGTDEFEGGSGEQMDEPIVEKFDPDQPRDEGGKWTSGGGGGVDEASLPAEQKEGVAAIKKHLEILSLVMSGQGGPAYVLEHGRPYRITEKSFSGPRMTPKQCYKNAAKTILSRDGLTYVEGYVHIGPLALEHAWTADAKGNVVDPTLKLLKGTSVNPRAYFGVPFSQKQVVDTMMKTRVYGIISHTNPDLFKDQKVKKFEDVVEKQQLVYSPPLEVHKACLAGLEAGALVDGVTRPLAEERGIPAEDVFKIAAHLCSDAAAEDEERVKLAWGGKLAKKWALRVLKKAGWEEPWHAVDLDRTLAVEDQGARTFDPTKIGEPIPEMVARVKAWLARGEKVKIFTARMADDPDGKVAAAIGDWTEKVFGQRLEATNEKTPGIIEITDDKAQGVVPNTGVLKYSEDQPRDESGRWTSGGGSEVGPDGIIRPKDSLGLRRDQLPQVRGFDVPELIDYLGARGVSIEMRTVPAASLHPVQAEINAEKVRTMPPNKGTERPLLVSSDDYITDGHHRWMQAVWGGQDLNVVRASAPIRDLLEHIKAFPKAQYVGINHYHHAPAGAEHLTKFETDFDDEPEVERAVEKGEESDDPPGEWITVEGRHILIGDDGEIKAGDPLLAASFPKPPSKAEIARANYSAAKADVQREADRTEVTLARALGATRTANNSPFDLKIGRWGLEIKTFTHSRHGKITMHADAIKRKKDEAQKEKLKIGTVVADKRKGQTKYYFTRGVGSFRIGSLQPVTLAQLKEKLIK